MSAARPLAMGVTGHRVLAEVDRIAVGVDDALDAMAAAFPERPVLVVSALAEGADRIVAQRALARREASLEAILPLSRDDYATDFVSGESRREFASLVERAKRVVQLLTAPSREAAYEAGGRYVLDHCDLLLAIWDGLAAQGQGGTGAIVAEARRRGLPLAWVHAGNRKPCTTEPTTLGDQQGTMTYERFPTSSPAAAEQHI